MKVCLPDGRKVVVLCDGEAFHGPGFIYGSVKDRVQNGHLISEAYFDAGYSVIRYSETEVNNGFALRHLLGVLGKLRGYKQVYRVWHPAEERMVA